MMSNPEEMQQDTYDKVMIDLGENWGKIVPLSWLLRIQCIDYNRDTRTVSFSIWEDPEKPLVIQSRTMDSIETMEREKGRLLSYVNQVLSQSDLETTLGIIAKAIGETSMDTLLIDRTGYDLADLRKTYSEMMGLPFYQCIITYNALNDSMEMDERFNKQFEAIADASIDGGSDLDYSERRLIMVNQVVSEIASEALDILENGRMMGDPRHAITTTVSSGATEDP